MTGNHCPRPYELDQQAGRILRHFELKQRHLTVLRSARTLDPALPVLPYHSPEHCVWVMVTFANLAVGLLGKRDLRHGLLTALYHDAAHPGSQDDSENTAASAAFWLNHAPADAGIDRDEVAARIMTTSTRTPREARTGTASQLLHDADLLQTVLGTPEETEHWQLQLQLETGKPVTAESSLQFVWSRLLTAPAGRLLTKSVRTGRA